MNSDVKGSKFSSIFLSYFLIELQRQTWLLGCLTRDNQSDKFHPIFRQAMDTIQSKIHKTCAKPLKMTSIEETIQLARLQQAANSSSLYERKTNQKALKVLTVAAYILFVSMAAIILSFYYVFIWDPTTKTMAPRPSTNCGKFMANTNRLFRFPITLNRYFCFDFRNCEKNCHSWKYCHPAGQLIGSIGRILFPRYLSAISTASKTRAPWTTTILEKDEITSTAYIASESWQKNCWVNPFNRLNNGNQFSS